MAAASEAIVTKLHYFNGRGLGEQIRFMMAACGLEWEECYLTEQKHIQALRDAELLTWDQVPLLELPGPVRVMQSMAAVRHLARTHDLYGKDATEMMQCDVVGDGIRDALGMYVGLPFAPDRAERLRFSEQKMRDKYLPCLERQLAANGETSPDGDASALLAVPDGSASVSQSELKGPFLVGRTLTFPDITVTEVLCYVAETQPELAAHAATAFPLVVAHHKMMLSWDRMGAFFASAHRHKLGDSVYRDEVRAVLD
jgi:glutathione S-transferase